MDDRITRYFLGELTKEERIRLLQERETNTELKEQFASFQNIQAMTNLSPDFIDSREAEKQYLQIEKQKKRTRTRYTMRKVMGYAAAATIAFVIGWMLHDTPDITPTEHIAAQQELYVPAGQRARITLPDGSVAWINAGSTLSYPSHFAGERKIELKGEGFFEVIKDPEKPFIVRTGDLEVKALGTQFNVYNYPQTDEFKATLTEGSILVYPTGKENSGQILEPNQRIIRQNGKYTLEKNIDKDELLWKEGIYSFKKQSMKEITGKLELYFDVQIIIENPKILDYEYTGKFRQRDGVLEILRIIQKIHKFKISSNEDLSVITLS